jgi:hypothetical protein
VTRGTGAGRPRWPPVLGWKLTLLGLVATAWVDRPAGRGRPARAGHVIDAFSGRLRAQVDLATLTGELLGVVDQTMQPTRASLWLRPQAPSGPAAGSP